MRVLLVEDNPIDAETLRDRLSDHAHAKIELTHVTRLAELAKHTANEFDVLLLDLSLPDGTGVDSIRTARARLGDLPIVVLTADDDEARSLVMLREGAQDYLVKGQYSADTLLRALRYARERHALKGRLAHADRLAVVGQLAAGVAHEVANPATLVLGNTELLTEKIDQMRQRLADLGLSSAEGSDPFSDCARMLEDNRNALERIRSVVRDLQGYSRINRSSADTVQLNDLVERASNLVRASLRHHATLELQLEPLPYITADAAKLEQVLTNLLINASHALADVQREDKRIVVSTRVEGDSIHLSVVDNGVGMSDAVRQRIFEPFFTTKSIEQGTGLGLSIAAEIVRQLGGEIACSSVLGAGTRFDVRLPSETGLSPASTSDPPPAVPHGRARVLVIDDERAVAQVYAELLSDQHDVVVAHGGREALAQLARDRDFGVVVCDLMMPEVDGVALFEHVEAHYPELARRFVFCSGGLVTARARDFAARVPNPLLYKPVSIEDMLRAIESSLAQSMFRATQRPAAVAQ